MAPLEAPETTRQCAPFISDGPKERIYVGGSEDFGYFEADALTHLPVYRSLTPTISVPGTNFSEIWQIHRVGSDLWFQSDFKMMRYDGRQTDVVALTATR